jgi:hypothetical protein
VNARANGAWATGTDFSLREERGAVAVEAGERRRSRGSTRMPTQIPPRGSDQSSGLEQGRGFEVLDRSVQREPASGAPVVATPRTAAVTRRGAPREKRGRRIAQRRKPERAKPVSAAGDGAGSGTASGRGVREALLGSAP